jgi:hypothetical protein
MSLGVRRYSAVVAALPLLLGGCGGVAPASHRPPAPPSRPSSNVADCFEGDCTLLLTEPATIPLDATKLYYPAIRVTDISADNLTYSVTYPGGGYAGEATIGVGLGRAAFAVQGRPSVQVGLILVNGNPALVLQTGPVP